MDYIDSNFLKLTDVSDDGDIYIKIDEITILQTRSDREYILLEKSEQRDGCVRVTEETVTHVFTKCLNVRVRQSIDQIRHMIKTKTEEARKFHTSFEDTYTHCAVPK